MVWNCLTTLPSNDQDNQVNGSQYNSYNPLPSRLGDVCWSASDCKRYVDIMSDCQGGICSCMTGTFNLFNRCSSQLLLGVSISFITILLIISIVFLKRRRRRRGYQEPVLHQVHSTSSFHQLFPQSIHVSRPESPPPPYVHPPAYDQLSL